MQHSKSDWRIILSVWKESAKKIPGVPFIYSWLKNKFGTMEYIFTDIFVRNKWGGIDSVSGSGSDVLQTRVIIKELPKLFREFNVHSILDIPCGDFHWMQHVDMDGVNYLGADIVDGLIHHNKQKYKNNNIAFCKLNLIKDSLPKADLVFCRDCLVHLSFKDVILALQNICNSEATYLLTTTFPARQSNRNIATGDWRTLNLEVAPFLLSPPLKTVNEECTEGDGEYKDKSLGLWLISDLRDHLKQIK